MLRSTTFVFKILCLTFLTGVCSGQYYGKDLGRLSELHHAVKGHVYAVDGRTLFIKDFTYDGEGPAAFFYVGNSKTPSNNGAFRLRDERGSSGVLKRYRGKDITLNLPEGKTLSNIKWLSVWCDEFSVNFGDVKIPRNFEYPKPQKLAALSGVHGVSSDPIVIVDAQTLLIPNFSYDGEAPDAKFWVGTGSKPTPQGTRIPDENGKIEPLRRYDHKTIVLTLPGDLTVFDLGHFGVWCEAFTVDFGHVKIPTLPNVPPSLKMLGVSPQSKLNCEVLYDDLAFEVRWAVAGDSVVMQLVAKLEDGEYMSFGLSGDASHSQMVGGDVTVAWVDKATLKGFATDYYLDAKSQCAGVRGSCPDERLGEKTNSVRLLNAAMVNGYSIVTYQRPLKAADELDRVVHTNGSQPVIWAIGPLNSRNEVSYHSHFLRNDKFLEFGRPPVWNCPMPETEEAQPDKEEEQEESPNRASTHGQFLTETSQNNGQDVVTNTNEEYINPVPKPKPVPTPKPVTALSHWEIPDIRCNEPEDGVFYAQMGPTGGKQGYSGITGHVGWGISWYINGLLIPEIHVVRGRVYNFVTEGGNDPDVPAKFHPFYITDDPVGGYEHKTPEEKAKTQIFAGVRRTRSGSLVPSGVGRLCNWTPDNNGPEADEYPSFGAFQRSLTLVCAEGEPGVVQWKPDQNTPDTVYYQCFTHRYLGWKIHVHDECDEPEAEASERHEVIAKLGPAARSDLLQGEEHLESSASIQVATRIKPDINFPLEHRRRIETDYLTKSNFENIENHNMNADRIPYTEKQLYDDDTLTGEVKYNAPDRKIIPAELNQLSTEYDIPITRGQLKQVIDVVEHIENVNTPDDRHPVYQHSTQSPIDKNTPNIDLTVPERPIRDDEELMIEVKDPSNIMLPPDQTPMTLQTFLRPNSKPGINPYFRRPVPPEIKPRRPLSGKPIYGMPPRNPPSYNNGQPSPMYFNKKQNLKGNINRLPMNGYGRPLINTPFKNIGHNTLKPNFIVPQMLNAQGQPIIMGKPSMISQTLTLGQPTIIGSHVVRTQMTLPSDVESSIQHSMHESYLNKPGQIILGKPMENPMPLDQQMIPTKLQVVRVAGNATTTESYSQSTVRVNRDNDITTKNSVMDSSELLSVSPTSPEIVDSLPPAVNTGFKPDSIVIESGFKPIMREPLMEEEEKIMDYVPEALNRRTDTDVSDQYEDNHQHLVNNNYYNDKITQSFEPIFIPSPPDRIIPENITDNKQSVNKNQYVEERPQPVYRPNTSLEELFAEKNMNKNMTSDDLDVAADGVNAFYLPPDNRHKMKQKVEDTLAEGTFVTYDGHTVSASTLTSVSDKQTELFASKLSPNAELLAKTPQFGPFKGFIPPEVNSPSPPRPDRPSQNSNSNGSKHVPNHSPHFELLSALFGGLGLDKDYEEELEPEHSEKHEVPKNNEHTVKENSRRKREANTNRTESDQSTYDHFEQNDSVYENPAQDHHSHNYAGHEAIKTNNSISSSKNSSYIMFSITALMVVMCCFS